MRKIPSILQEQSATGPIMRSEGPRGKYNKALLKVHHFSNAICGFS
jgi:hypothetical protein